MKRDLDLIRRILMDIQSMPAGEARQEITYAGEYDPATIAEHVALLIESDLIKGEMLNIFGNTDQFMITGLTWKGHDFIDAAKNEHIWAKAKKTVLKETPLIAFDVLLEWLKIEMKKKLGLL